MAKSTREIARLTNVKCFGVSDKATSARKLAKSGMPVPKKKRDFDVVLAQCDAYIAELEGVDSHKVSQTALLVFKKILDIARRDPIEDVEFVRCPKCHNSHAIYCPDCDVAHSVPVHSASLEKNQLTALGKLADKLAPNLTTQNTNIDINVMFTGFGEIAIELIQKYAQRDKTIEAMTWANKKLGDLMSIPEAEVVCG
jgi:hypothetical protein